MPLIVLNCSYRYEPPSPRQRRFHEALGSRRRDARRPVPGRLLARPRHRAADRGDRVGRRRDARAAWATGRSQAELERRAADPRDRRARPDAARRPAGRAPALGRVGRRRRDADPADDAQPSPDDAEQAVRGDGRRRARRRERPARHGRHRPRDRLRACSSTRPIRPRSRRRSARCSSCPRPRRRRSGRRGLAAAHATYNWERQLELLLAEYGRLTGRPW